MDPSSSSLSSLIGSRICHDLISPIGAITNGLELLEMAGGSSGPEMALIEDSVQNAGARIQFFRLAFGVADESLIATSDVARILQDLEKAGRLTFDLAVTGDVSRSEARLVCLGIQCLETALAFGGNINIELKEDVWSLRAEAQRLKLDDRLWTDLTNLKTDVQVTPATVQFALLADGIRDAGRQIRTNIAEQTMTVMF